MVSWEDYVLSSAGLDNSNRGFKIEKQSNEASILQNIQKEASRLKNIQKEALNLQQNRNTGEALRLSKQGNNNGKYGSNRMIKPLTTQYHLTGVLT